MQIVPTDAKGFLLLGKGAGAHGGVRVRGDVWGYYTTGPCGLINFELLYLDSTKFDRFPIIRSRPSIKNWSTKNTSTRQYLEIEDEDFGKLEFYGEWSENEIVEAEGFCKYASVLPHTDKKETVLLEEAKAHKAPQNVKPKPTAVKTKEAAKKPKPAENVKELAEKPKEPTEKAQKAPQNVKPKPAAVKTKEAAKKPKPAENVKELAEKPKEPTEKAQKAPQNVKPKPAAVKTKEAAKKPKPAENVKELAEKPKEPAEKAQKAPQNVKPKPAAMKTKEAAKKTMPAENVKELAEKPKELVGDDYQVVLAATVMKAEDRKEFEVETFTQWIEVNIDWVGEDELHAWPRVVDPVNMVQPLTPKRVFSSP
nr:hypothetical protein [Tanacetum cinerariifolium]